ncbi:hypothetical protein BN1723_006352, partial [Verticillium longisporum]
WLSCPHNMPRVWRSPNSATWVPLPSPTHSHEWLEADMGRPLLSPSQGRPTNPKVAVIGAGMKLRSPEADLDANYKQIDDVHEFEGQFLHGQAYKSPADFEDKNIIVLGMGNSAGDTACELTEYAAKVYLAHRRGAKILPRANEDGPLDSYVSWKISRMALWTEHHAPGMFQILADGLLQKNSDSHFNGEEAEQNVEWGLEETSGDVTTIICNDHLKRLVHEKRIASVKGVKRIIGPRTVELDNGDIIDDVDAIIACTGYRADFSLLPDLPSTQLDASLPAFPDLYQMIFPPRYADSLACTNYCIINESAAAYRELQAMAIAQDAALASLFLACKVEDTIKKSKEILCAAYNIKNADFTTTQDDKMFEQPSKIVIGLERLILETIGFDFRSRYAQKYFVKAIKTILGPSAETKKRGGFSLR